jgi:hypothetical protein
MASQIAHIIYARKYFEKHPAKPAYEDEFILGCVFPDIRRIDENVKRKDTHMHFENCNLDFKNMSAFEAGWKFHAYCDMKREEILNNLGFYEIKGTADFWGQVSKQLEDELLYDKYNNWEKLVHYFNNVPVVETGVDVSRETFQLWYAIIGKYIEKKPNEKAIRIFLSKQIGFVEKASEVANLVDKLGENEKVRELLNRVVEEIV